MRCDHSSVKWNNTPDTLFIEEKQCLEDVNKLEEFNKLKWGSHNEGLLFVQEIWNIDSLKLYCLRSEGEMEVLWNLNYFFFVRCEITWARNCSIYCLLCFERLIGGQWRQPLNLRCERSCEICLYKYTFVPSSVFCARRVRLSAPQRYVSITLLPAFGTWELSGVPVCQLSV